LAQLKKKVLEILWSKLHFCANDNIFLNEIGLYTDESGEGEVY